MEEILVSELDTKFKYEIAEQPGAENFRRCFACGTCTAVCPVGEVVEEYDPRKIIRMAILGMRKEVLSSPIIWMCVRCHTCYARCPQNVEFADIIGAIREIATKEGYVPPQRIDQIIELDKFTQKLRSKLVEFLLTNDKNKKQEAKNMIDELNP